MLKPSETGPGPDPSLGDLVGRLFDDGKAYARAEMDLARAKAEATVTSYRTAALLAAAALAFGITALVMLFIALGAGLATLVGPLGGNALSAPVAGGLAVALALAAKARSRADG